jgi:hypothetical protein
VDCAAGGGDFTAGQFLSKTHLDVPTVYHKKVIITEATPLIHAELERIYDKTGVKPVVSFERNFGGMFELDRLHALNRLQKYRIYRQKRNVGTKYNLSDDPRWGLDTNVATRTPMLNMLKEAVDKKLIQIYDRPTINEMFSFVEVRTTTQWRAQAEKSAHDDLVMAMAQAMYLYQTEEPLRSSNRRVKRQKKYNPDTGRVIS